MSGAELKSPCRESTLKMYYVVVLAAITHEHHDTVAYKIWLYISLTLVSSAIIIRFELLHQYEFHDIVDNFNYNFT